MAACLESILQGEYILITVPHQTGPNPIMFAGMPCMQLTIQLSIL